MQLIISGIPIEVQKKNIKNMHLYVKPPDGHVIISAPSSLDDKAIEIYARTNLSWIKAQIKKYQDQPRSGKRQYVSGETIYILGVQYYLKFVADSSKNGFSIVNNEVILSMNKDSTVKQRESYVREQYREILKQQISRLLPKWEKITELSCESWQTKYMVTRWGTCNTERKKLWFNLQLAQKPIECIEYVILHELIHLRERNHNAVFIAYMDLYMPNWREVRKELNDRKLDYYDAQDESPLKKLIDRDRYDVIKDAVISYLENNSNNRSKQQTPSDVAIENVVRIEQPSEGVIQFDVIASCDVEKAPIKGRSSNRGFIERWVCVKCQVLQGIELTDFQIITVSECEPQDETENSRFSGELVPILAREDFEKEAETFLERFYPAALENPVRVPIQEIAEKKMGLTIYEDSIISKELHSFGMITFEDCNIQSKTKKIVLRNIKRGTVFIDPEVSFERTLGTRNSTLAHECYHWFRHQPYHALMKMIDADDDLGKNIQCSIEANKKESDKWKAVDWMEWQANGVATKILMPEKTTRKVIEDYLLEKEVVSGSLSSAAEYKELITLLSETYGVSKQAVKIRMLELGYVLADGAYAYVDGKPVSPYTFSQENIDNSQTFTICSADLFKAYNMNRKFREIIRSGRFVYVDGHLCLNDEKYVICDEDAQLRLTDYALSHMDECCLTFELGYSYESKYQGLKNYNLMMFKSSAQAGAAEYSFEMNAHNKAVLAAMDSISGKASVIRKLPGGFGESLAAIMKSKKINGKELSNKSLVGEKTIQRIKNVEEYPTTKQAVLGICVGLELSAIESKVLFNKSDFKLSDTNSQDLIYMCVLDTCPHTNIYDINEMLEARGVPKLGSRPDAFAE